MECYHCAPVHPELVRLLPEFRNGTSYQGIPGDGTAFADDIDAFTLSGRGQRPRLPGLVPEDDRLYFGLVALAERLRQPAAGPRHPPHRSARSDRSVRT